MVIVVFRFHAKPEANLEELGGLAAKMAGFAKDLTSLLSCLANPSRGSG